MRVFKQAMRAGLVLIGSGVLITATCQADALDNFNSDGCSLFPDGTIIDTELWRTCCYTHDLAYWRGGIHLDKLRADENLRQCVLNKTGNSVLARVMYLGVTLGGSPVFPTWYRWGYGWSYGRGYRPLTEQEEGLVEELSKLRHNRLQ